MMILANPAPRTRPLPCGCHPRLLRAGSLAHRVASPVHDSVYWLLVLFMLNPLLANAKHVAPPDVQSITNLGIRYVVPNDKGLRAYVEAWDVQTGQKLWTKTIFTHCYIPPFGTECIHYEYLAAMVLENDKLVLTSERGRVYALDIHTKSVRRVKDKKPTSAETNHRPAGQSGGSDSRTR